ncbi:MAG: nucleoside hydrolase [Anaerolineae bacterium]
MPRKIVIDTDPGVDDAMAIFYALKSPELEVLGLTTIFGNAHTDQCTMNALRLLEIAGRPDIPVAGGAPRPLVAPFGGPADFVHGRDGQGNTFLPPPSTSPVGVHAAQFLIDTVMSDPGNVTIVALGPLTNVAMALLLKPDLASHIREIVLMGGSAFVPGNVSPAAEANIHNDPEAADIVFGAGCPVTMVGLDVTMRIQMSAADLDLFGTFSDAPSQHVARIMPFYLDFYRQISGRNEIVVHDSTTITWLLHPELFTVRTLPVRVETEGMSRGKTWPANERMRPGSPWEGRPPVQILVGVNGSEAARIELDVFAR